MADNTKPDYSSPDFDAFAPLWAKVDACLIGTEAMRVSAGKSGDSIYLPQFPLEADDSYRYRLETSTFLPAYGNALDSIVGAITKRPPKLSDAVSPAVVADFENIDNAGTHWTVEAQRLLREGVHYGAAYVLTEMPQKPDGILDAEQAERMNFRPFSILYSAKELANWPRYVVINGSRVLQQIIFREMASVPNGFGDAEIERYRVWQVPVAQDVTGAFARAGNAEWQIWEEREIAPSSRRRGQKKTELVMVDAGVSELADIPVAVFNANPSLNNPEKTDGSVLIDLANLNIKHYQLTSDHEKILHKCTPVITAVNRKEDDTFGKVAGLDVMIDCKEGGGVSYAEPEGSSLLERREWIAGIEKQMLEMGASLFAEGSQKSGMTATEINARGDAKQSRISQIAEAWKDCLNQVLAHFAQWKSIDDPGEVIPGVKSADLVFSSADLPTVSLMVEKGQHSLQTLWQMEQKLGILPDDFDAETELEQIAEEKRRLTIEPPEAAQNANANDSNDDGSVDDSNDGEG